MTTLQRPTTRHKPIVKHGVPLVAAPATVAALDPWAAYDGFRWELGPDDTREPSVDAPARTFPSASDHEFLTGFDRGFHSDYMAFSTFDHGTPEYAAFQAGHAAGLDARPWMRLRRARITHLGRTAAQASADREAPADLLDDAERSLWLASYDAAALEDENLDWTIRERDAIEAMYPEPAGMDWDR